MESIGQILKSIRERQGLTIPEVALAIKAKQLYIKAIEADQFDELIAPVYAKGFIKLYAEYLGLDPQPLLNIYPEASKRKNVEDSPETPDKTPAPPPETPVVKQTADTFSAKPPVATRPKPERKPTSRIIKIYASHWRAHTATVRCRVAERAKVWHTAITKLPGYFQIGHKNIKLVVGPATRRIGATGLNYLRDPRHRKICLATAVLVIIIAAIIGIRGHVMERRSQYTPDGQYGLLRNPPEPYP